MAADLPAKQLDARPTRVRWLIFALICCTSFTLYLHRYTWGFIKSDVREEFGWSYGELGFLDSSFSFTYGLGQVPTGVLCDWFGPHALLGLIILAWSLAMGAIVLVGTYVAALISRLAFGVAQAGCYPTLSKVTKLWFPLRVRTSVQASVATLFGRGGGAASFILVGTVLMGWCALSWRQSLLVLTAFGLAFGLLFIWLFRNTPREHKWANDAEVDLITEGNPEVDQATRTTLRWGKLFRSGNMWIFFFQQFTSAFADNLYVYWIPIYLLTAKNLDVKEAGWMSAVPLLGGAIGGMIGGMLQNYLIAKTGKRRWCRSLFGFAGKGLATVFIFMVLNFESAILIVSIFFVVKFFGDWSQPTVWGTITDVAGRNSGSVFGAVNTVGCFAALVAGPAMGMIIDRYSTIHDVKQAQLKIVQSKSDEKGATKIITYTAMKPEMGGLSGKVYVGDSAVTQFTVDESGDFTFKTLDSKAQQPLKRKSRLDTRRGKLTLEWQDPADGHHVVADYKYKDYSDGWTTLFITIGGIYLASSLSWLFINCTKKIEEDQPALDD